MASNYPLEIKDLDSDTAEEIKKYFKGLRAYNGFVTIGPKAYIFPKTPDIKDQMNSIYTLQKYIQKSDIFVATFPRSGTTLTQELVWLVANDLDYNTANSKNLVERYTALGSYFINPETAVSRIEELKGKNCIHLDKLKKLMAPPTELLANIASPRFIKCHIPLSMLPPNILDIAKVVYVARDPRDVAVSLYHLSKLCAIFEFVGDFKTFWDFFTRGLIVRAPYFEQIKEAWEVKDHPNMLFLFYEELSVNMPTAIKKISTFLGKNYTDEQIAGLSEHLKFENFKRNQLVNVNILKEFDVLLDSEELFMRKGKVGGWGDYFDEEMAKQAESWMETNIQDIDLRFKQSTRKL